MFVVRVDDPHALLDKAREENEPIRVLRTATALPQHQGGAVVMRPAVMLRYSVKFPEAVEEWFFEEVKFEDAFGRVNLADTFWAQLQKEDQVQVLKLRRSGSI